MARTVVREIDVILQMLDVEMDVVMLPKKIVRFALKIAPVRKECFAKRDNVCLLLRVVMANVKPTIRKIVRRALKIVPALKERFVKMVNAFQKHDVEMAFVKLQRKIARFALMIVAALTMKFAKMIDVSPFLLAVTVLVSLIGEKIAILVRRIVPA